MKEMKEMKTFVAAALGLILILQPWLLGAAAGAKLDCGQVTNKSDNLPRTIAIGTNPAGTGAHALGSGLAAVASKATSVSGKVQPYNGPNAWMTLLDNGELEFGIINILDSKMAATGTGNYKKAYPSIRIARAAFSHLPWGSWTVTNQT
ncbi:MAG: TAXI family TRAP transporter solute-binding subunit [Candidatus Binatia bacterium]